MFLTSPNLVFPNIAHGFFMRTGGVSAGIYASLNCGPISKDNPKHVQENRARVAQALGGKPSALCGLHQIHSTEVLTVTAPWKENEPEPQADAMVSKIPGLVLGVLSADCLPVLFADTKNGVVGAAHAGWKGALGGILPKTAAAMVALGAEEAHISAAIGPAIAQASYEVGSDFRDVFITQNNSFSTYFISAPLPGKFLFALAAFARQTLTHAGIKDINILGHDTYVEDRAFFSYRRSTHQGAPDYGRQMSAITLKTRK